MARRQAVRSLPPPDERPHLRTCRRERRPRHRRRRQRVGVRRAGRLAGGTGHPGRPTPVPVGRWPPGAGLRDRRRHDQPAERRHTVARVLGERPPRGAGQNHARPPRCRTGRGVRRRARRCDLLHGVPELASVGVLQRDQLPVPPERRRPELMHLRGAADGTVADPRRRGYGPPGAGRDRLPRLRRRLDRGDRTRCAGEDLPAGLAQPAVGPARRAQRRIRRARVRQLQRKQDPALPRAAATTARDRLRRDACPSPSK